LVCTKILVLIYLIFRRRFLLIVQFPLNWCLSMAEITLKEPTGASLPMCICCAQTLYSPYAKVVTYEAVQNSLILSLLGEDSWPPFAYQHEHEWENIVKVVAKQARSSQKMKCWSNGRAGIFEQLVAANVVTPIEVQNMLSYKSTARFLAKVQALYDLADEAAKIRKYSWC
jgi:hypothetical protein